jgi:hypothetical protein
VKAKVGDGTEVTIREDTDYPFSDVIRLTLSAARQVSFPLYLRIPGWCQRAWVEVNGEAVDAKPEAGEYLVIEREWRDGDAVELTLPMDTEVRTWTENQNAVSIHRGPLAYSLKIGERWERYGGTDEWPACEVFPTTPWNYGLVLPPAGSFDVLYKPGPLPDQPFTTDGVRIELCAKGKRIPCCSKAPSSPTSRSKTSR